MMHVDRIERTDRTALMISLNSLKLIGESGSREHGITLT